MNGWMDGIKERRLDGWMDGWMFGRKDDESMDGWLAGQINGQCRSDPYVLMQVTKCYRDEL